jgi:hypothetical protein
MDRETLRTNYRALLRTLYSPRNYYDRVKTFLAQYKEPREKALVTPDVVLAVIRCFFWLGLVREGRRDFWRIFFWTFFHKRESVKNFLGLAILGYHFRKVQDDMLGRSRSAPQPTDNPMRGHHPSTPEAVLAE